MAKTVKIKNKPKRQSLNLKLNITQSSIEESAKITKETRKRVAAKRASGLNGAAFGKIKSVKYDRAVYLEICRSRFVQRIKDLYGDLVSEEDMINMQKAIISWTDKDFYRMTQVLGLEKVYYDSDNAYSPFDYDLVVDYEAVYDYIVRFKPGTN